MTLTLLLDLDGPLLGNEVDSFVTSYSKALADYLAPYVEPARLMKTLNMATQAMLKKQSPGSTLQASFEAAFYPALGLERSVLQRPIASFYAEVFPTLKSTTEVWPEAIQLVEEGFGRGYRMVIATNPLFPRTAIEQRLAWAGLPPDKYPFALIPSYETFHFAKPNPAYFAEILSLLGWPADPIVMVGNEIENDINGACLMGLSSFLVVTGAQPTGPAVFAPTASGRLNDILPWLASTPPESLQPDYTIPTAPLATLRATPAVLPALVRQLPANRWTQRPLLNEWSLTEILCHLRDVESEVNLDRFQKILQLDNPFLPGMDTDPWAETRQYALQDGQRAVWDFIDHRLNLLSLLDGLSPAGWKRPARHAIFGPTHLLELAGITASHDRLHSQQVHQLLEKFPLDGS